MHAEGEHRAWSLGAPFCVSPYHVPTGAASVPLVGVLKILSGLVVDRDPVCERARSGVAGVSVLGINWEMFASSSGADQLFFYTTLFL